MNAEKVFPLIEHNWSDSAERHLPELYGGLTKRELAATEIMAHIVGSDWTSAMYAEHARRAVLAADALLAELAK